MDTDYREVRLMARLLRRLVLFVGKHCMSVREWGDEYGRPYGAQSS